MQPAGRTETDKLQERKKETIKIIPKKEVISLISGMVCFHKDPLTNWRIVATRLKTASIQDASKIFYSIRLGTYLDSTDIKGAFLYMCVSSCSGIFNS